MLNKRPYRLTKLRSTDLDRYIYTVFGVKFKDNRKSAEDGGGGTRVEKRLIEESKLTARLDFND